MNYYFPTALTQVPREITPNKEFTCSVNSGKNALRLLLRSLRLPAGSKVAIPAYVCPAVAEAVKEESLQPAELDLKSDGSFWTDYQSAFESAAGIKAIVLAHLYGYLHPDTATICKASEQTGIAVIHDAAQSYGIDESKLCGKKILYSLGPGKATTAAGGGWIKGIDADFYTANVAGSTKSWRKKLSHELFLRSRIYGYHYSLTDRLKKYLAQPDSHEIHAMSDFQIKAGSAMLQILPSTLPKREEHYQLLLKAAQHNPNITIPYHDKGDHFKIVLNAHGLCSYLEQHQVPSFSLFDKPGSKPAVLRNFNSHAHTFVEISCEASIPYTEIARIAEVLSNFQAS